MYCCYQLVLHIVQLSSLLILSTSTATTGSGGLSTDQKIEIGVSVGGTLLGALVTILVATGIFKCRKRRFGRDPERQPLLHRECVYV